jgi:hypothetical protein
MNKKYTISIPVQVDFEGNQMSPQTKTIDIVIEASTTEDAVRKITNTLQAMYSKIFLGHY